MNVGWLLCLLGLHDVSWAEPARESVRVWHHFERKWVEHNPYVQMGRCGREGCGYALRRDLSL